MLRGRGHAKHVWAVGYSETVPSVVPMVSMWNGTAWNLVNVPAPGIASELASVATVSANEAWAVGTWVPSTKIGTQPLIEHWLNGAWSIVPSPQGKPNRPMALPRVAADDATHVWAVGQIRNLKAATGATLIEEWNGQKWSIVPSPNVTGQRFSGLEGVTAVSAGEAWAVGTAGPIGDHPGLTLTEHWLTENGPSSPAPTRRRLAMIS